jgi:hypothetical protein
MKLCHCGTKAFYNFKDEDERILCAKHKEKKMINVHTKEHWQKRLVKKISEFGWILVGKIGKSQHIPIDLLCTEKHKCKPTPANIFRNQGICNVCSGQDFETAKKTFIRIIEEENGGLVIGEYKGKDIKVSCICPEGHTCMPYPSVVREGGSMCKTCIGQDSEVTKKDFYNIIEDGNGGLVMGDYIDSHTSVPCICPEGHPCSVIPGSVLYKNNGMCRTCAGQNPEVCAENFYSIIEDDIGGRVLGIYIDAKTPVHCLCPEDHECYPSPNRIQQGGGMCDRCSQSRGEKILCRALEQLDFCPIPQAMHFSIPTLRYDYSIVIKDKIVFFEFHGIQHEEISRLFHEGKEDFEECRQRDLLKIYIAVKNKIKLIILDHKWAKKPLNDWVSYLKSALERNELLIADSELHVWVKKEKPSHQTIRKYVNICDIPKI